MVTPLVLAAQLVKGRDSQVQSQSHGSSQRPQGAVGNLGCGQPTPWQGTPALSNWNGIPGSSHTWPWRHLEFLWLPQRHLVVTFREGTHYTEEEALLGPALGGFGTCAGWDGSTDGLLSRACAKLSSAPAS